MIGALFAPLVSLAGVIGTFLVALVLFWIRGLLSLLTAILRPLSGGFSALYDGFAHLYHVALVWCLGHRAVTLLAAIALIVWGGFNRLQPTVRAHATGQHRPLPGAARCPAGHALRSPRADGG